MKHIVATLIAASLVVTTVAQTAEVRVMSAGATAPAYLQLVPQFESKTRLKAVTLATSTGLGADAIVARVRGGEPVDVIFLAANVLDDLVKEGLVTASSRIDIARSSIGVAVRAGAPSPTSDSRRPESYPAASPIDRNLRTNQRCLSDQRAAAASWHRGTGAAKDSAGRKRARR